MRERWLHALVAVVVGLIALRASWIVEAPPADPARASELLALHDRLFDDVPRPTGSAEAAAVRARVSEALGEAGCEVRTQQAWSCGPRTCANVTNLWCRLGPSEGSAVLGLAHTDSVAAGPGAADDGAGVVAWVDAVQKLAQTPLRRPWLLVLTDGEELGLLGAKALVADPPFSDPIGEVINLEARGTGGASVLFQALGPRPWGAWYGALGLRPNASSLYPAVYDRMPNGTDLTVFAESGLAGADHAFIGGLQRYHTPLDDRAHLDARSLVQQADTARAWVEALQAPSPGEPLAYVDLLGLVLLVWPLSWGPFLAWLAVGAAVAWCASDLRKGAVTGRDLGRSLAAAAVALLAVVAWTEAAGILIGAFTGPVWWGSPARMRAVTAWLTLALLAPLGAVGTPLARWHAVLLGSSVAGALLTTLEPRLAVLWLPATGLALGWRLLCFRWRDVGLVGLAVGLCAAWLPLARGLEEALTLEHPAVVAVPLALGLLGTAPFLPRAGWRVGLGGLVASVLPLGLVWASPPFTAENPQPGAAIWRQSADGATLLSTQAYVGLLPGPEIRPEASLELPPPLVTAVGEGAVRVVPSRGGTTLEVTAGEPFEVDGEVRAGPGRVTLHGVPPEGVVLRIGGAAVIGEVTPGLPAGAPDRALLFGPSAAPAHGGDQTIVEARPPAR